MRRVIFILGIVLLLALAACVPSPKVTCAPGLEKLDVLPVKNATSGVTGASVVGNVTKPVEKQKPAELEAALKADKVVTEGEIVSFPDLKATDPDGDKLTYTFSAPLNAAGVWVTKVGDAGEFKLVITVSDGKSKATKEVVLVVLPRNRLPVIDSFEGVTVKEGETVLLPAKVSDADGDKLTVMYGGWMSSDSKKTTFLDAGDHKVTLSVSDGTVTVNKSVVVKVLNVNRPPVLAQPKDVAATEEDVIKVISTATDPDGNNLTISFTDPLDASGVWKTKRGDAGTYKVNVTVTDGELSESKRFLIAVEALNHAPVITGLQDITVNEGETVMLKFTTSDKDNDALKVTISGWMTSTSRTTGYGDAGVQSVTVTADDGTTKTVQTIKVTVKDVNRPPVFE